jgi:hypothetical protein
MHIHTTIVNVVYKLSIIKGGNVYNNNNIYVFNCI